MNTMLFFYELDPKSDSPNDFFCPIRSKRDVMVNMFKMIKRSSWMQYKETPPESGFFFAYDRILKRAFINTECSTQSIAFPFPLRINKKARLVTATWKTIDIGSNIASLVISALNEASDPYINLQSLITRTANENYPTFGEDLASIAYMLSELANLDDGYFRQDHDIEHANGYLHPLDHIDIYHSNSASMKVGLSEPLQFDAIRRLISKDENAYYLTEPR